MEGFHLCKTVSGFSHFLKNISPLIRGQRIRNCIQNFIRSSILQIHWAVDHTSLVKASGSLNTNFLMNPQINVSMFIRLYSLMFAGLMVSTLDHCCFWILVPKTSFFCPLECKIKLFKKNTSCSRSRSRKSTRSSWKSLLFAKRFTNSGWDLWLCVVDEQNASSLLGLQGYRTRSTCAGICRACGLVER